MTPSDSISSFVDSLPDKEKLRLVETFSQTGLQESLQILAEHGDINLLSQIMSNAEKEGKDPMATINSLISTYMLILTKPKGNAREQANEEMKNMNATLLTEKYRRWELAKIKKISADALPGVEKRNHFPHIQGKTYPIINIPGAHPELEFSNGILNGILKPRKPRDLPNLLKEKNPNLPDWVKEDGLTRADYFRNLAFSGAVRGWNIRGFSLESVKLNEKNQACSYEATLCTYGENCLTSHVLSYDLYREYAAEHIKSNQHSPLPRPKLTLQGSNLTFPKGFFPLISVQGIVLFKEKNENGTDEWQIIVMQRGGKVASASGFWQLPPAGGFEIEGDEENMTAVEEQFDIQAAITREFLEEIYGIPEEEEARKPWEEAIKDAKKKNLIHTHFLGLVIDAIGLRTEFSFLFILEDATYFKNLNKIIYPKKRTPARGEWMRRSSEARQIIQFPLKDCEKEIKTKTWCRGSVGMIQLLTDQCKEKSWLITKYPDLPEFKHL